MSYFRQSQELAILDLHVVHHRLRDHWTHSISFPIGCPSKHPSRTIAEILSVKHLAQHILTENALVSICVLGAK